MKKLFVFAYALFMALGSFSQTVNYALENADGTGSVNAFAIRELNDSPQATFQMWLKPQTWTAAKLLSQDNFSVEFGEQNTILVKSGDKSATIATSDLLNVWSQLTITVTNGFVRAYINNVEATVTGTLPTTFQPSSAISTDKTCIIGQGLVGQIDEIRIWNKALEQEDFFWRNTLNKFNPNYDALVAYWKCDQDQCPNLVDYKFAHHGVLNNLSRVAVTDNANFRYRVVTGYTNLARFTDRPNINRDMFLMTNDIILLSGKVQNDGSIFPEYPDNSATPTNVDYLKEFEGHTGVMHFKGAGSQMVAQDGRAPFNPESRFGYESPKTVSLAGWIYIDSWKEGAEIFSKTADTDKYLVVKLGSESDKSIIVDMCGFVATLKGKLEVGKWQYLGVYLAPTETTIDDMFNAYSVIKIGVDFTNYTSLANSDVFTLSGKSMTYSSFPLYESPIIIGRGFSGKMDNLMLWGGSTSRINSAKSDAENGYQWNVGSWDNIFLNAYWTGDDPENVGKDSQSYTGMIDFIRNYYKNHRGAKIRLGLIYPNGDGWQKGPLTEKANVDRFIADAKVLLENCDGLDVDLEWSYSQWQYDILNNVVKRLIDEVMAGHRDTKIFSVSLHQVSYGIDKKLIDGIDYFTFQLYGPQTVTYTYDWYTNAYQQFMNYGFPKEKTLLSYGVLLVNGSTEQGYKDLFEKMGMKDENYDSSLNIWNGWYFNGVDQTKRKQDFIIDKDCLGTMYFDMGNDQKVSDYKSLIRAQNDIIASNVDSLITEVNMVDPSPIEQTPVSKEGKLFSFYPNPANDMIVVSLSDDSEEAVGEICTLDGKLVMQTHLYSMNNTISLTGLNAGFYLLKVRQGNRSYATKLCIN